MRTVNFLRSLIAEPYYGDTQRQLSCELKCALESRRERIFLAMLANPNYCVFSDGFAAAIRQAEEILDNMEKE